MLTACSNLFFALFYRQYLPVKQSKIFSDAKENECTLYNQFNETRIHMNKARNRIKLEIEQEQCGLS